MAYHWHNTPHIVTLVFYQRPADPVKRQVPIPLKSATHSRAFRPGSSVEPSDMHGSDIDFYNYIKRLLRSDPQPTATYSLIGFDPKNSIDIVIT